ncbi:Tn3 family transposase [Aneurinibacillus aneurinilyticus]|uniref:Tn3 family transposase n=1 Tax=Aneurinibacillus aneurinilyticus TaxID=1391 RepID=UPI002E20F646|nr:Tn3 family transposase [Aneurinibacillus aneurinilyticus]MED0673703.1 Tn3 family transposase [Aneurinibacillus aneurinilyticus]
MPSIQETAYPRLKSSPTPKDLDKLFSPAPEEITWAKTKARNSFSQLGLMIMLKTFQCLNYFVPISDVPQVIIKHIAKVSNLDLPDLETLKSYHRSGTGIRQIAMIREYRKVKVFDEQARQVMITAMENSVSEKDAKSDIINVAIDELVKHSYELPAFSTLVKAVDHIHAVAYRTLYQIVSDSLSNKEKERLDALFQSKEGSTYSDWNMIKQDPGRPTLGQLKEWIFRENWINERNVGTDFFQRLRIPPAKITRLADEAITLDAAGMKKVEPYKRYTLAVALLFAQLAKTIDDIGEMYTKRVAIAENKAEKSLNDLKEKREKQTDVLISTLRDAVVAFKSEGSTEQRIKALEKMIGGNQGQRILENCETHLAYTGNNYFSFMWKHLKSNRSELIKMLESLELKSTTQNKGLEQAISFLLDNKNKKSEWIPITRLNKKGDSKDDGEWIPLVDLSWVPEGWWRWISPHRRRSVYPKKINRRHFEACVFYQIRNELKSGDLCIEGSEKYADYRKQLVSWEEYQENLQTFCEQAGLPTNAQAFKEQVYKQLEKTAQRVDSSFPNNKAVTIRNGEPFITKMKKKQTSSLLKELRKRIEEKMVPINVLDLLADTEYWLNWTRFFGPISGHDAKIDNPSERYITTTFCYGCNLGPTQTARSLGNMDRKHISWINERHVTEENIQKAIEWIINAYNKFNLPKYWGTGTSASADGTKWDLYEQNLLSENHIRYGGYGGIGYYHVSDTYIALFSHFIPCGVWEGVYILDILMKNQSDIQPDTLHSDTQGQNAPIFGLAYLLGIKLMPRIRNWKDLKFLRPSEHSTYQHIDELFSSSIDWKLIEDHYEDMLRVVMSIKAGRIHPSTILNKLGTYSKKNKLYQAFRELGCAIRTLFLLNYLSDEELRSTIQAATNKSESFNGFTKWLSFGGDGVIAENNREKQKKTIKYNHLVANCLIFYNVFQLTHILHEYMQEGNLLDEDALSELSPYLTFHVNRFGKYRLDSDRRPPDLEFDIPVYPFQLETVS